MPPSVENLPSQLEFETLIADLSTRRINLRPEDVHSEIENALRREQCLQESKRRLAAGADIAGLAFYEVDFEGGAMYVGDRFRDLFGIPADQGPGLSALSFWMKHLHPDDRSTVLCLREELHSG